MALNLPPELVIMIYGYLGTDDFVSFVQCCRYFLAVAQQRARLQQHSRLKAHYRHIIFHSPEERLADDPVRLLQHIKNDHRIPLYTRTLDTRRCTKMKRYYPSDELDRWLRVTVLKLAPDGRQQAWLNALERNESDVFIALLVMLLPRLQVFAYSSEHAMEFSRYAIAQSLGGNQQNSSAPTNLEVLEIRTNFIIDYDIATLKPFCTSPSAQHLRISLDEGHRKDSVCAVKLRDCHPLDLTFDRPTNYRTPGIRSLEISGCSFPNGSICSYYVRTLLQGVEALECFSYTIGPRQHPFACPFPQGLLSDIQRILLGRARRTLKKFSMWAVFQPQISRTVGLMLPSFQDFTALEHIEVNYQMFNFRRFPTRERVTSRLVEILPPTIKSVKFILETDVYNMEALFEDFDQDSFPALQAIGFRYWKKNVLLRSLKEVLEPLGLLNLRFRRMIQNHIWWNMLDLVWE